MRALSAAVAAVVLASGCTVAHGYLVEPRAIVLDGNADEIAATRVEDGRAVRLSRSTVVAGSERPQPDGRTRLVSRSRSEKLDGSIAYTFVGSAISIAGSLMWLLDLGNKGGLFTTGLLFTISAEPMMILGTVRWIQALKERPQER